MSTKGVIVTVESAVRRYYQGEQVTTALDGVSLKIEAGDFIALAGPSGSGKTTLLNLIGGLDVPDQGEVFFEGRNLHTLSAAQLADLRRDRIGFIFQAYNLIPVFTAYENAELVLLLQGAEAGTRRQKVMQVLESVGLKGMEQRLPSQLSGGQQQRVAIARAIASEPALILADEPTANLDSKTAQGLLETMRRMNEQEGRTFIFSTHDPAVMQLAKKLVLLKDGKIASIEDRR